MPDITINIDKHYYEFCSIDTEDFLSKVLGEPIDISDTDIDESDYPSKSVDEILDYIAAQTGKLYTAREADNTYNYESDLSNEFVYCVFYDNDNSGDHFYSDDTYVAVCVHQGGDVRGNYGSLRLYKVDSLASAGFYDRTMGWYLTDLHDNHLDENGRFQNGWSANPTCHLSDHCRSGMRWSEKHGCFLGFVDTENDGNYRMVKAYPELYAGE